VVVLNNCPPKKSTPPSNKNFIKNAKKKGPDPKIKDIRINALLKKAATKKRKKE